MPPDIDIYGLTKHRDEETINAFIDQYIDLENSEDRGNEELMILSLDSAEDPDRKPEYEWELAGTLTHIIQRGWIILGALSPFIQNQNGRISILLY